MLLRITLAFLAIGILFWTIFSFPTAMLIAKYYSFKASVAPDFVNWSHEAIHDELWRPVAEFGYTLNGKVYREREVFQGERFRNPYAANAALEKLKKEYTLVWYDPNHPSQASMEKFYPTKKNVYSLLALGIIFYGVWIGSILTTKWMDHHTPQGKK